MAASAQMAVAASAAVEIGAVGLGTLITILATTLSIDVTGILMAVILGLFMPTLDLLAGQDKDDPAARQRDADIERQAISPETVVLEIRGREVPHAHPERGGERFERVSGRIGAAGLLDLVGRNHMLPHEGLELPPALVGDRELRHDILLSRSALPSAPGILSKDRCGFKRP